MLKTMFIAAAASLVLAGAAISAAPSQAMAGHSGCHKAAKAMYPTNKHARHSYKKACKAHYKAHKKGVFARLRG